MKRGVFSCKGDGVTSDKGEDLLMQMWYIDRKSLKGIEEKFCLSLTISCIVYLNLKVSCRRMPKEEIPRSSSMLADSLAGVLLLWISAICKCRRLPEC